MDGKMPMIEAVVGVDIGTTGCRAAVYTAAGAEMGGQSAEYPLYTPYAGWAEQDAEEIWRAFVSIVAGAVAASGLEPGEISGISLSTAFHSLLPVDREGNPLGRLMTWGDSRSQPYTEQLKQKTDMKAVYRRTGCPLHPMYMPSKILWLRHEQPDIFRRAKRFVTIKDFLLYRLTGRFMVDRSIASGGGFYNFKTMDWDEEVLALAGVSRDQLSTVASSSQVLEGVNAAVAGVLGLSAGVRVVLGAGDGAMANLGSGVVRPGQMTATVGTSGAVRMLIPAPQTDEKGRTWCYNLDDRYWMAGAAINNGGISLRWVRDQIATELKQQADQSGRDAYELLTDLAASVPAGSDGLLLLPLFTGERAPYWNADARAVMFGLNLAHEKRHIIRAAMEGVIFRMYSIFTALEDVAGTADEIRVSGSFTHSSLWLQMMADIFGRDVLVPDKPEGAVFGAAAFGMVSLGILPDIESIGQFIRIKKAYHPAPDTHAIYQELFAIYQRLYWNLQNEFRDIAAFQRKCQ